MLVRCYEDLEIFRSLFTEAQEVIKQKEGQMNATVLLTEGLKKPSGNGKGKNENNEKPACPHHGPDFMIGNVCRANYEETLPGGQVRIRQCQIHIGEMTRFGI